MLVWILAAAAAVVFLTTGRAMRIVPSLSGLVLGFAVVLAAANGALAKPAYVTVTVNLRSAPGTTNEIVGKIPAGSLIDADNCTGGWCAVTWQDKSGFVIQTAIDLSGRVPPRRVVRPRVYYDHGPVYYAPPPPVDVRPYYYRHYDRPWRWHRYRW